LGHRGLLALPPRPEGAERAAPRVQEEAALPVTEVLEHRPHEDGYLQLELRRYVRRDGSSRERGPYWYFQFHEGGKRKKLYLVVRQPFTLLQSISTSEWDKCLPHAYLKGLTAKL
jgi:hypothetical protein